MMITGSLQDVQRRIFRFDHEGVTVVTSSWQLGQPARLDGQQESLKKDILNTMDSKKIEAAAAHHPSPPGLKHTFGTAGFRAKFSPYQHFPLRSILVHLLSFLTSIAPLSSVLIPWIVSSSPSACWQCSGVKSWLAKPSVSWSLPVIILYK